MDHYAQMPSGLILPENIVRQEIGAMLGNLYPGNFGAYRSASASNKNTATWSTSNGSADADTLSDLPTLRRQSRDLVRNEALPAGAISTMVGGVIGRGIVPQARIDYEFLGITEEEAAKWESAAERIFEHTASKPSFDLERKLNFWQQQRLIYRSKLESGDAWALRRYIPRAGKALGVCVQIIEADRVSTPSNLQTDGKIREGVEVDDNGAPAFYHFSNEHPGDKVFSVPSDKYARVPAFDRLGDPLVLPVMNSLRPGQTRGVPHLAPVIELFKQLGRYSEAEVAAAVISGMFAVFVTSPAATSPLAGGIPGMVGGKQVVPNGSGLQKMQSGMIVDLAPGEEIKTAEAGRPNTAFEPFINAVLSQIGTALGLPREVMLKSYNTSYSAARAAIMDAYRAWLIERDDMISQFCQPVWSWVITEAVAKGLLDAPGFFSDPLRRDAWLGTDWIGAPAPQIDPTKEAKAAESWLSLGIKSKQDVSGEQGFDYERTLRQRAKEKRMEAAAGLAPEATTQPANKEAVQ